jgi:adenosine kinase
MEILVSGSLAYDRIMTFPGKFADHILPEKIHILNVCFTVNGLREKFGGTAGNIAFNLSLLQERPRIVASIGKDFDGYRDWLLQHRLPLDGIREIPGELTASAYITTDESDNQITGFNPGAMKYPSRYEFVGLNPKNTLMILAPGCIEDMLIYSGMCRDSGIPYIFDPGQSIPAISKDQMTSMMSGAALMITNDYELEMIRKKTGLNTSEMLNRTAVIITTLGEHGSVLFTGGKKIPVPACGAERIHDPTGAGDAYRAGLIKGMVTGKGLLEAARMGATCASFAVEHHGTQEHRFTIEEFWERHLKNFGS